LQTFKYKGISRDGQEISGIIKAYDEYEAVANIRETCRIVTKIEEIPESAAGAARAGKHRFKEKELALICSQFAIIIKSGLPIVECVRMVAAQAKNKEVRKLLYSVADDVEGGYSLAQSFESNGKTLPITFIETVRAGELSGTLEESFDRMHKYFDKTAKTKAKIVSTLTYPVMVIIMAIIVFVIIMVKAVPMFIEAFSDLGSDLPAITRGMIAASNFIRGYWWVFILLAAVIAALRFILIKNESTRRKIAEYKLSRSPLKHLNLMNSSSQFANTMSTMLTSGLNVIRALEITSAVVSNFVVGEAVSNVKRSVEQGRSLAESMSDYSCFPPMLTEMTGVGEKSGSMEETLSIVGDYYDNEVEIFTTRFLAILEPVITIFLAVFVVILLLSIYLPMFSMYDSVSL
jgi:type IV pilus assembly protein PilC